MKYETPANKPVERPTGLSTAKIRVVYSPAGYTRLALLQRRDVSPRMGGEVVRARGRPVRPRTSVAIGEPPVAFLHDRLLETGEK